MNQTNVLLWAFFAAYVVHVLDETLMNGGFVKWISENFWPRYHARSTPLGPPVDGCHDPG
jgi:hypothetical protein